MAVPSFVIRSASHGGTRPPCSGRSATPDRFIVPVYASDLAPFSATLCSERYSLMMRRSVRRQHFTVRRSNPPVDGKPSLLQRQLCRIKISQKSASRRLPRSPFALPLQARVPLLQRCASSRSVLHHCFITLLESTLTCTLISVDSKELAQKLSPSFATLTQKAGRGSATPPDICWSPKR